MDVLFICVYMKLGMIRVESSRLDTMDIMFRERTKSGERDWLFEEYRG